jgi:isoamylase
MMHPRNPQGGVGQPGAHCWHCCHADAQAAQAFSLYTEGPTDDSEVKALRARQQRNFLATLLLSQGIPMLLGGDEIGRSQGGNNNGYCQDNEISWFDWEHADSELLDFTTGVIRLWRDHPVFRQRRWFQGRVIHGGVATSDIDWYKPDGQSMSDQDWQAGFGKSLGIYLNGKAIPDPGPRGERIEDDRFYLLFNAHHEACTFIIPGMDFGRQWVKVPDTNERLSQESSETVPAVIR